MPKNPFHKLKTAHERALEPKTLAPNPFEQEGKPAILIAVPALAILFGVLIVAQQYRLSADDFMLLIGSSLGGWFAILAIYLALKLHQAVQYAHFDRIFGFTERLHPRYEIYSEPKNIRMLIEKGAEFKDPKKFQERLEQLNLTKEVQAKLVEKLGALGESQWYLYYFQHIHEFEGWDAERGELPLFKSHAVFMKEPYDKQFIFGQGQENWLGAIYYNHPHSEMDVVKVLTWVRDPFLEMPMPLCVLVHSSLAFKAEKFSNGVDKNELDVQEALALFCGFQHGLLDSQWKGIKQLEAIKDSKIGEGYNALKIADEKTNLDMKLFEKIMRPRGPHFWQKGWFKILTYLILVAAIIILVAQLTGVIQLI